MRSRPVFLRAALVAAAVLAVVPAFGQTTPQSPSSPQPKLPSSSNAPPSAAPPGSPIVDGIVETGRPALHVRKGAEHVAAGHRHHRVRLARRRVYGPPIERPALAGVELLAPLARPPEPPHLAVPMPAYALDSVATALFEPPPPITCRRTPRRPDLPDAGLAREVTLACVPDNP